MNLQKRLDKVIDAVEARVQDEVGALLGADFSLIKGDSASVSKETAFDGLLGKQICSHMDITGEVTGKGCLLVGIKDAIRLGGTLIMLPAAELEEVIGREEYTEELEDSYGEIANIVAGSFTKDFEEMYPKSCRFVRKEQETIVPSKVVTEGGSPIANITYYQVSFSMVLDGRQMGNLIMLMPAAAFGLEELDTASSVSETNEVGDNRAVGEGVQHADASHVDEAEPAPMQPVKPAADPNFDREKHRKRVDKLLKECQEKMESEVGALLGVDIVLGDLENTLLTKADFLENHTSGRQVLTDMEVVGDLQDKSYLSISIKDAIHLGGILIMLPPTELEKVVKEEDFSEDAQDAYGEIANIVSGVYTAVFEEQYNKKLRFIRKEAQVIVPAKVDIASDTPLPDKNYYASSSSIAVEGKQLGKVHMLFPAEMLQLNPPEEALAEPQEEITGKTPSAIDDNIAPEKKQSLAGTTAPETNSSPDVNNTPAAGIDSRKQKKLVDKILAGCKAKMADEVGALLGTDIKLTSPENRLVTKEEFFFDEVTGKQVIANMDVVGELEGKSYLSVSLRDAIRIGGTLIMLPASELEAVVNDENFGEDTEDAYGEIANIISGVYTAIFEEQYSKKIRFIKTDLHQVAPMKVDINSEDPIADQDYYLSKMDLTVGDLQLGNVCMLLPADLFQLTGLRTEGAGAVSAGEQLSAKEQQAKQQNSRSSQQAEEYATSDLDNLDVLVVGDDRQEAEKILKVLGESGYTVKCITFKDNLHNYIPGNLKAIYLVMKDVNEQAFGVAIKVSSACTVPLIAAGPDWTRTKVIKAVKYGVRDILLTPASDQDIAENLNNNLLELAA